MGGSSAGAIAVVCGAAAELRRRIRALAERGAGATDDLVRCYTEGDGWA